MTNHADYAVHEVELSNGKTALRAYVSFDQSLVNAMRSIGKRTERLSFGKDSNGRPFWSIAASSKEVDDFRAAMDRAAVRAADKATLSNPSEDLTMTNHPNRSKRAITWRTHKTDSGFQFDVYVYGFGVPHETLKTGECITRQQATGQAKRWARYLKQEQKRVEL